MPETDTRVTNGKDPANKKKKASKKTRKYGKQQVVPISELQKAHNLADKYFNQLMYLQADFDNYRKQASKELEATIKQANKSLITDLLPVIDDLERAISLISEPVHLKGIKMVYDRLMEVLKKRGLEPINAIGKLFDPYYHEALLKEPSEQPENIVIEEFRKGYLLNKEVIRYSQVKVSGGTENDKRKEK
ncbi:MAG: nucleotide exchange factor GrpE [Candidatus Ranarchaeia archaeon]